MKRVFLTLFVAALNLIAFSQTSDNFVTGTWTLFLNTLGVTYSHCRLVNKTVSFEINPDVYIAGAGIGIAIFDNKYKKTKDLVVSANVIFVHYMDITNESSGGKQNYIRPAFSILKTITPEIHALVQIEPLSWTTKIGFGYRFSNNCSKHRRY